MLVIRQSQMDALGEPRRESFARRTGDHLRANFPECAAMPVEALRAFVDHGVARAASYGIEVERDVCKFLNLMAVFGRNFDVELPWAKETLRSDAGPRLRLNRLYMRGQRIADQESGS